jgi:hypothetical protein
MNKKSLLGSEVSGCNKGIAKMNRKKTKLEIHALDRRLK